MNQITLFLFLMLAAVGLQAQNKSLAVGTTTPNPNAALHIESPTNNQGAIMPRLTTVQRTAMTGILGTVDAGLLLYDTDIDGLYVWNGTAWQKAANLSLPFKDSVTVATGTTDLFALKYNNAEHKRVLRVESLNPANGSTAVSVSNNSNGLGIYVQNNNINTISSSIMATNASDNLGATPSPVGVYGEATGLAASGGSFRNINASNDRAALYAETLGTGPAVFSRQSGANGNAGYFWISNATNGGSGLYARTDGTGAAVSGLTTGTGYAGSFEISNAASTNAAILAQTSGVGPAIQASQSNGGLALDLISGGLKYSVLTISSLPATLTEKVGVVNVTVGSGTLTFSNAGRVEGETIIVVGNAPGLTVAGLGSGGIYVANVNPNDVKTFIFVNGYWVTQGMYPP